MEVLIEKANAPNRHGDSNYRVARREPSLCVIDKDIGSDPNSLLRLLGFEEATQEEILEIERLFMTKSK